MSDIAREYLEQLKIRIFDLETELAKAHSLAGDLFKATRDTEVRLEKKCIAAVRAEKEALIALICNSYLTMKQQDDLIARIRAREQGSRNHEHS